MEKTQYDEIRPRLFAVRDAHLGQDDDGPDGDARSDGGDDDGTPPCVDCQAGVPVEVAGLRAGDRITEVDTPGGPLYAVLEAEAAAGVMVFDARMSGERYAFPVQLGVDRGGYVLKEPGSPAN